jgi:hypothetical protein
VKPEFTQEQLASAADTITFAGKIVCEANPGPFVVHIFPPPPADGGGATPSDSPPQLITEQKVEKVGEFTPQGAQRRRCRGLGLPRQRRRRRPGA